MPNQKVLLSYREIMLQLNQLCLQSETGTAFISTHDGKAATFVFEQGAIVSSSFNHQQGLEAIRYIKTIAFGYYVFTPNVFFSFSKDAADFTPQRIFAELGHNEFIELLSDDEET